METAPHHQPRTSAPADSGSRILVFAPGGRDSELTYDLLAREAIPCEVLHTVEALCQAIPSGAALLLTEEAFDESNAGRLIETLLEQPAWSDIPVLLLAGREGTGASDRALELLDLLPNVTLLDRPIRVTVVVSIIRAAIRARRRQYQLRDVLLDLHASREDADAASRLKDEFLATLSHELRTPLNAIVGWTTMLRTGQIEPSQLGHALEIIDRNARAQAQLVEDVLDMARVITGKLRIDLRTVSLPAIIQAAAEAVRPAADAKHIRLVVDNTARVRDIVGDPGRLQQVFWNLLSNAVKFTLEGGEVRVDFETSETHVVVTVTDSGVGLAPEFVPHMFDRFRQADQSVTRLHGGLGLGLAIVKQLVELHGGQVDAASEGPGKGTTFRIKLPIPAMIASEAAHAGRLEPDAFTIRLTGTRVLVVDDDAATRELLEELFGRAEADVMISETSSAALDAVRERQPDVVVADIGLPHEDGYALMRKIRALPAPAGRVPALALSAYTRAEDRGAALAAGFNDFIGKPATPQDLLRAVERLLH